MEEKLEKMFEIIKQENKDYKEHLERGDLFIPNELYKDFKPNEIFYISDYYMNNKNQLETDKRMKQIGLSKYQIKKIKQNLTKLGILKKIKLSVEELKEKTIKLSGKGLTCEWCGNKCYILHEHHYPIPKKNGGTRLVNICPNCHYTFHKLESENENE